jgi:HPt (histidine-containing phosphotransfer) domain-containing protein
MTSNTCSVHPLAPAPQSEPRTGSAPLDPASVARLQELDPEGRHGVVNRVLGAFETSLIRMLDDLQRHRVGGDAAVVGRLAHTLKSSSASVGALALAAACAEVEARLRLGAEGELSTDVARLIAEGQAALASVEAMLRPNAQS